MAFWFCMEFDELIMEFWIEFESLNEEFLLYGNANESLNGKSFMALVSDLYEHS